MKKLNKKATALGGIAAMMLSACPSANDPQPECVCDPKEHYTPCSCEMAGTNKCSCTQKQYGEFSENSYGTNIPIFIDVDDSEARGTANAFMTMYDGTSENGEFDNNTKDYFDGKIKEIRIINGTSDFTNIGNKYIIKLEKGKTGSELNAILVGWEMQNLLSQIKQSTQNAARLAMTPQNKAHALSADFGKRKNIQLQNRMAAIKAQRQYS
ncbi:MAG: hypothetical protein LBD94_02935 [Rickettsiales bacterium]|jgi:hypothetical protein|nr:hypothetical protein [Rickettsiales bacterium]